MSRLWLLEAVCSVKLPLVGYIDMTILAHHFGIKCIPGYREQFEVSPTRGVILKGNPSPAEGPQDTVIRTSASNGHGVIITINASHVHIVTNQHIAGHDVGWTFLALFSVCCPFYCRCVFIWSKKKLCGLTGICMAERECLCSNSRLLLHKKSITTFHTFFSFFCGMNN